MYQLSVSKYNYLLMSAKFPLQWITNWKCTIDNY